MGEFEVIPTDVAVYADILRKQGEYQDDAIRYLDKHIGAGIKDGDGLIIPADEFNPEIVEAVRSAIKEARSFFEESAAAMQDVADYYETADTDSAAKLDRTYTDGEGIIVKHPDGPHGASPPTEIIDPRDVLKAPGKPEEFDDGPFKFVKKINELTSLSTAVRELGAYLNNGNDPFKEAVKEIVGDWMAFAKASKACENLAEFYLRIYANLMQVQQLSYYWTGNASDIAIEFFMRTGRVFVNLDYLPQPVKCTEDGIFVSEEGNYWGYCQSLPLLAEEYLKLASDVSESANAANGALDALIDSLLLAIGAGVAGFYGSPSGVGLIVGEGTAAAAVAKAVSHIKDYTGALGAIRDTVGIFTGLDSGSVTPMTRLGSLKIDKPYATPKGM